jgi:hypothetical protein
MTYNYNLATLTTTIQINDHKTLFSNPSIDIIPKNVIIEDTKKIMLKSRSDASVLKLHNQYILQWLFSYQSTL